MISGVDNTVGIKLANQEYYFGSIRNDGVYKGGMDSPPAGERTWEAQAMKCGVAEDRIRIAYQDCLPWKYREWYFCSDISFQASVRFSNPGNFFFDFQF